MYLAFLSLDNSKKVKNPFPIHKLSTCNLQYRNITAVKHYTVQEDRASKLHLEFQDLSVHYGCSL